MYCPACGKRAQTKDSREVSENRRRRRYTCVCGTRFTTIEEIVGGPVATHDQLRKLKIKNALRDAVLKAIEDA